MLEPWLYGMIQRDNMAIKFVNIFYNNKKFVYCYFYVEYVNDFDAPVAFQCPNGGALDGVGSYHDNGPEDRRFRFYCCEKPGDCYVFR